MSNDPVNGDRRTIDGKEKVFYEGSWIRFYQPPDDSWSARKELIDHLTRRTFHHTEAGINTPGDRLDAAREAYEGESDPARKRVNAAMLAGALFNRATDIFTAIVNLADRGVEIRPSNALLRQCGRCFTEALELGKQVKHHSGEEGIDELWGEPLKVFIMPLADYYASRYMKVALAMRDINAIGAALTDAFDGIAGYEKLAPLVKDYVEAGREEVETMRSDPDIFHVWPRFVAAGERLLAFRASTARTRERRQSDELRLIAEGRHLISYVCGARVPMPKSTDNFLERCRNCTSPPNKRGDQT